MKIGDSKPVPNFKLVVSPNEWQKKQRASIRPSEKREKYRIFFQSLIDELKEKHGVENERASEAKGGNSWGFPSDITSISYDVTFPRDRGNGVEIKIDFQGYPEKTKRLFNALKNRKEEIEALCEVEFEWHEQDESQSSKIAIYREGDIWAEEDELNAIRAWHIDTLLKFREKLTPLIEEVMESQD